MHVGVCQLAKCIINLLLFDNSEKKIKKRDIYLIYIGYILKKIICI